MDIKTYPEMNETIKDLLRQSEEPMNLYILARIEELEKQVADLTPPPNAQLTLEELREMDGEPVWFETVDNDCIYESGWAIVSTEYERIAGNSTYFRFEDFGFVWIAYRRKPEEAIRTKHICGVTGLPCCWCNPGPCSSRKRHDQPEDQRIPHVPAGM